MANFTPEVTFFKGNHYLKIGSRFTSLTSKYQTATTDRTRNNKFYWFPTAEILIAPKDEVKFYAGVDGGIKLNTYTDLLHDNPFWYQIFSFVLQKPNTMFISVLKVILNRTLNMILTQVTAN